MIEPSARSRASAADIHAAGALAPAALKGRPYGRMHDAIERAVSATATE